MSRDYTNVREALEEMAWQFAYRGVKNGQSCLYTGGTSALETAFEALGWGQLHIVEDTDGLICDVEGCAEWVESQGCYWAKTGYWMLCDNHSIDGEHDDPQPAMKQRAIDRENSRDEHGNLP